MPRSPLINDGVYLMQEGKPKVDMTEEEEEEGSGATVGGAGSSSNGMETVADAENAAQKGGEDPPKPSKRARRPTPAVAEAEAAKGSKKARS